MPHESASVLIERLLVQTLAVAQGDNDDELPSLLSERARTLAALSAVEIPDTALKGLQAVMRAERAALQSLAGRRAEAASELGRQAAGRKIPATYARPSPAHRLLDASQ